MPLFQNEFKSETIENEFDLHENEPVGGTHFHMNGFALRLVLKQRQKRTRKWPIVMSSRIQPSACPRGGGGGGRKLALISTMNSFTLFV